MIAFESDCSLTYIYTYVLRFRYEEISWELIGKYVSKYVCTACMNVCEFTCENMCVEFINGMYVVRVAYCSIEEYIHTYI